MSLFPARLVAPHLAVLAASINVAFAMNTGSLDDNPSDDSGSGGSDDSDNGSDGDKKKTTDAQAKTADTNTNTQAAANTVKTDPTAQQNTWWTPATTAPTETATTKATTEKNVDSKTGTETGTNTGTETEATYNQWGFTGSQRSWEATTATTRFGSDSESESESKSSSSHTVKEKSGGRRLVPPLEHRDLSFKSKVLVGSLVGATALLHML